MQLSLRIAKHLLDDGIEKILVWFEIKHVLFFSMKRPFPFLSRCQVCAGLNETFHLWLFFPLLKTIPSSSLLKQGTAPKWKSDFLFVKHQHKMFHPFWKISFSLCHLLTLSLLLLAFDWNYFIQIHSFTQMLRSPWNCIFERVNWDISLPPTKHILMLCRVQLYLLLPPDIDVAGTLMGKWKLVAILMKSWLALRNSQPNRGFN